MNARIVSCTNQKGGVGKTRTVIESAYIAGTIYKQKVLVIDLDPQSNASSMLCDDLSYKGVFELFLSQTSNKSYNKKSVFELLKPAKDVFNNVICLTSDDRLSSIDAHISGEMSREYFLKKGIEPLINSFDLILIDLAPTSNILTVNALVASTHYIIPTCLSELGKKGSITVKALADQIISSGLNPSLEFIGVFLTLYQKGHSKAVIDVIDSIKNEYQSKMIDIKIPHSTKAIDASKLDKSIYDIDPANPVSIAYKNLATNYIMEKQ